MYIGISKIQGRSEPDMKWLWPEPDFLSGLGFRSYMNPARVRPVYTPTVYMAMMYLRLMMQKSPKSNWYGEVAKCCSHSLGIGIGGEDYTFHFSTEWYISNLSLPSKLDLARVCSALVSPIFAFLRGISCIWNVKFEPKILSPNPNLKTIWQGSIELQSLLRIWEFKENWEGHNYRILPSSSFGMWRWVFSLNYLIKAFGWSFIYLMLLSSTVLLWLGLLLVFWRLILAHLLSLNEILSLFGKKVILPPLQIRKRGGLFA